MELFRKVVPQTIIKRNDGNRCDRKVSLENLFFIVKLSLD